MHIVVYLDVLFAINVCMNGIVLACMRRFLRQKRSVLRILTAAAFGAAAYCSLLFLPMDEQQWIHGLLAFLIAAVMVRIAFSVRTIRIWMSYVALQYITAGILGCVMNLLYDQLRTESITREIIKGGFYKRESWGIGALVLYAAAAFCIFRKCVQLLEKRRQQSAVRFQVSLWLDGHMDTMEALLDTGNLLMEPISHAPVLVGDMTTIRKLFTKQEQEEIQEFYESGNWNGEKKISLIPYRAVGVKAGILLAFLLEEIAVWQGEGQDEIRRNKVYLAVSPVKISGDGSYQLLLHPRLLQE